MSEATPDPTRRAMVTASTMLAAIMVMIDSTIANVALPHIQSSLSASPEQVVWVVTSYIVAQAIATPLAGWLATRFGRRTVMAGSIALFTVASVACGLASSLEALVAFRFVQGLFGAATIPLSQASLLDVYPAEQYGKAMAFYGLGSMFGGVVGPIIGGALTEFLSWRWIFLINLPVGILTATALYIYQPQTRPQPSRFDLFGFAALSIALASFQLMIDRGAVLDWFDSTEIWIEAVVAAIAFYIFLVHIVTARDPYIKPALFRNRNFLIGIVVATGLGVLVFGVLPIFGTMLQTVYGYPVLLAGEAMVPRSIGTALSMFVAGWLLEHFDARLVLAGGIAVSGLAFWQMSGMSMASDTTSVLISGLIMGIGSGLLFVPLSTMAFTTLPAALRNEGTAMVALFRFIGTSVGVSLLQAQMLRNAAAVQSRLAEGVRPDSQQVLLGLHGFDFSAVGEVAILYRQLLREAMMVAYVDIYWLMCMLCLVLTPLAFAMKLPAHLSKADRHAVVVE